MTVDGESSGELQVQVMIRNPISGNALTETRHTKHHHMNSKLYVGNLSFKTTEAELRDAFGQFGTVTDVYIASDRETGRPRGFAFVTFATAEESKVAVEKMNGVDLDGRQLTVNEAKPKEEMGGSRGFNSPNRQPGAFKSRY
jgi:cold-inducible RNA-binding protein